MKKEETTPEQWFSLSEKKRKSIYSSWDIYKGDGIGILKAVLERFRRDYVNKNGIININSGLYHGGDWIISVTIEWNYKDEVKLPNDYYGFTVQKFYDKIPASVMAEKAKKQFKVWYKELKENKELLSMIQHDDFLKNLPKEKLYEYFWLMDGMSKYYNPFQKKEN